MSHGCCDTLRLQASVILGAPLAVDLQYLISFVAVLLFVLYNTAVGIANEVEARLEISSILFLVYPVRILVDVGGTVSTAR